MLISNDRDEMMPLWYMQQVEGRRPDLAGVFPLLLTGDGSVFRRLRGPLPARWWIARWPPAGPSA